MPRGTCTPLQGMPEFVMAIECNAEVKSHRSVRSIRRSENDIPRSMIKHSMSGEIYSP